MGCHTRCLIAHKQAHNARKPSRKCSTFLFHSEGRRRRHGDGRQDASRALRARPDTPPGPSDAGRQDAPPARPRRGCCKAAQQLHRHAATAASQRGTKGDLPSRQRPLDVKKWLRRPQQRPAGGRRRALQEPGSAGTTVSSDFMNSTAEPASTPEAAEAGRAPATDAIDKWRVCELNWRVVPLLQ